MTSSGSMSSLHLLRSPSPTVQDEVNQLISSPVGMRSGNLLKPPSRSGTQVLHHPHSAASHPSASLPSLEVVGERVHSSASHPSSSSAGMKGGTSLRLGQAGRGGTAAESSSPPPIRSNVRSRDGGVANLVTVAPAVLQQRPVSREVVLPVIIPSSPQPLLPSTAPDSEKKKKKKPAKRRAQRSRVEAHGGVLLRRTFMGVTKIVYHDGSVEEIEWDAVDPKVTGMASARQQSRQLPSPKTSPSPQPVPASQPPAGGAFQLPPSFSIRTPPDSPKAEEPKKKGQRSKKPPAPPPLPIPSPLQILPPSHPAMLDDSSSGGSPFKSAAAAAARLGHNPFKTTVPASTHAPIARGSAWGNISVSSSLDGDAFSPLNPGDNASSAAFNLPHPRNSTAQLQQQQQQEEKTTDLPIDLPIMEDEPSIIVAIPSVPSLFDPGLQAAHASLTNNLSKTRLVTVIDIADGVADGNGGGGGGLPGRRSPDSPSSQEETNRTFLTETLGGQTLYSDCPGQWEERLYELRPCMLEDAKSLFSAQLPVLSSQGEMKENDIQLCGVTVSELFRRLCDRAKGALRSQLTGLDVTRFMRHSPSANELIVIFFWFVVVHCRRVYVERLLIGRFQKLATVYQELFPKGNRERVPDLLLLRHLILELEQCSRHWATLVQSSNALSYASVARISEELPPHLVNELSEFLSRGHFHAILSIPEVYRSGQLPPMEAIVNVSEALDLLIAGIMEHEELVQYEELCFHRLAILFGMIFSEVSSEEKDVILQSYGFIVVRITHYALHYAFPNDVNAGIFHADFRADLYRLFLYWCSGLQVTHVAVKGWPVPLPEDYEAEKEKEERARQNIIDVYEGGSYHRSEDEEAGASGHRTDYLPHDFHGAGGMGNTNMFMFPRRNSQDAAGSVIAGEMGSVQSLGGRSGDQRPLGGMVGGNSGHRLGDITATRRVSVSITDIREEMSSFHGEPTALVPIGRRGSRSVQVRGRENSCTITSNHEDDEVNSEEEEGVEGSASGTGSTSVMSAAAAAATAAHNASIRRRSTKAPRRNTQQRGGAGGFGGAEGHMGSHFAMENALRARPLGDDGFEEVEVDCVNAEYRLQNYYSQYVRHAQGLMQEGEKRVQRTFKRLKREAQLAQRRRTGALVLSPPPAVPHGVLKGGLKQQQQQQLSPVGHQGFFTAVASGAFSNDLSTAKTPVIRTPASHSINDLNPPEHTSTSTSSRKAPGVSPLTHCSSANNNNNSSAFSVGGPPSLRRLPEAPFTEDTAAFLPHSPLNSERQIPAMSNVMTPPRSTVDRPPSSTDAVSPSCGAFAMARMKSMESGVMMFSSAPNIASTSIKGAGGVPSSGAPTATLTNNNYYNTLTTTITSPPSMPSAPSAQPPVPSAPTRHVSICVSSHRASTVGSASVKGGSEAKVEELRRKHATRDNPTAGPSLVRIAQKARRRFQQGQQQSSGGGDAPVVHSVLLKGGPKDASLLSSQPLADVVDGECCDFFLHINPIHPPRIPMPTASPLDSNPPTQREGSRLYRRQLLPTSSPFMTYFSSTVLKLEAQPQPLSRPPTGSSSGGGSKPTFTSPPPPVSDLPSTLCDGAPNRFLTTNNESRCDPHLCSSFMASDVHGNTGAGNGGPLGGTGGNSGGASSPRTKSRFKGVGRAVVNKTHLLIVPREEGLHRPVLYQSLCKEATSQLEALQVDLSRITRRDRISRHQYEVDHLSALSRIHHMQSEMGEKEFIRRARHSLVLKQSLAAVEAQSAAAVRAREQIIKDQEMKKLARKEAARAQNAMVLEEEEEV